MVTVFYGLLENIAIKPKSDERLMLIGFTFCQTSKSNKSAWLDGIVLIFHFRSFDFDHQVWIPMKLDILHLDLRNLPQTIV